MKTIKILPTKTEGHLRDLIKNYSDHEWGNAIEVKRRRDGLPTLDQVNVLLINFWQSLIEGNHDFLVTSLSCPQIYMKKPRKGGHVVLGWKMQVYKKKEQEKPKKE